MNKYELITRGIILLYLVVASSEDLRKKRVSVVCMVLFIFIGIISVFLGELLPLHRARILGLIPGAILVGVSKLSGENIGMGDALIIIWLGYMLGLFELLVILATTGLICFIAAGILYCRKKRGSIPFVPFLCVGYYLNLWSLVMGL